MENYFFYSISQNAEVEFKEKGSKFIGYSYSIKSKQEFKSGLKTIKNSHPKASHHCYAYRFGIANPVFAMSDDGEPNGTAGLPIFQMIDKYHLSHILVVVVRYFGGTLLGKGGLVKAYQQAADLVLQASEIRQFERTVLFEVKCSNDSLPFLYNFVKKINALILDSHQDLFSSTMKFEISLKDKSQCEDFLTQSQGVQYQIQDE